MQIDKLAEAGTVTHGPALGRPRRHVEIGRAAGPVWRTVLSSAYGRGLLTLAVVYTVLYGGVLVWTDGLPYVSDNNESFSTLWHAHNLHTFDFGKSWGLTDEAYGPNPAAHPFIHSHQGNFPRLFAFLIYVLGARTIEAQIVITTLTIGSLTVFLLYHVLTRLGGPRFGLVTSLVFLTDYLYFAQWHVVTYRVWHGFFVFAGLLCAYSVIGSAHRRRWLLMTALTFAGLFYYELIFVAFVSLLCAFFAVAIGWRTPRRVVLFGVMQALGGATALAILVLQLAAYLGWDGLREDLYLTYVARNFGDPALQAQIEAFYDSHNALFFKNVLDSSPYRTPSALLSLLLAFSLQGWTPLLVVIVLVVAGGWLLGLPGRPASGAMWRLPRLMAWLMPWSRWLPNRTGAGLGEWSARGLLRARLGPATARGYLRVEADIDELLGRTIWWLMRVVPLTLAAHHAFVRITRDRAFLGVPPPSTATDGVPFAVSAFLFVGAMTIVIVGLLLLSRSSGAAGRQPAIGRVVVATLLLWLVGELIPRQPLSYQMNNLSPIWWGQIEERWPVLLSRAAFVAAVAVGAALALSGSRRLLGQDRSASLTGVAVFLACGAAAQGLVFIAATGYVISGYVWRFAPLYVFVLDVILGVVGTVLLTLTGRAIGSLRRQIRLKWAGREVWSADRTGLWELVPRQPQLVGAIGAVAVSGLLCAFTIVYWLDVQRTYVALLPPTHFRLLKLVTAPPYHGASFVVNMIGSPVAAQTQQWAYFDPQIDSGIVKETDSGFVVDRDLRSYLWLADRRVNAEYERPQFYACMIVQDLRSVLARLVNLEAVYNTRCSDRGIIRQVDAQTDGPLHHQVVARDDVSDSWVILKLDWEYPPYLAPFDDGSRVIVSVDSSGELAAVTVDYRFAQQDGQPEQASTVRLYRVDGADSLTLLGEATGEHRVTLPAQYSGRVRVSVTPRTATREGRAYFSDDVIVTAGAPGR